jgi:hypothetical protein
MEFIPGWGVLDFNALFSSDQCTLFFYIDILRLLGYPVQFTVMSLERDLKLNDLHLIKLYQASLLQTLINRNVASRIYSLYIVETSDWLPSHELKFKQINRDV